MSYHPVLATQSTLSPTVDIAPASPHPASLSIALLGYRSHPHVGGQGIYLQYLSKALVEMGHRVDVLSGPPYPELDPRVRLVKIPSLDLYACDNHVTALRWRHLRSFTDTFEWFSMLLGGFPEPYTFGRRVYRYLQQHGEHYDIIHDNQSLCFGLLKLQKAGFNVVSTIHHPITQDLAAALQATTTWQQRLLVRRWYSFLKMQTTVAKKLRHVVTVSKQSQNDISHAFARAAQQTAVIPNGIDIKIFAPQPHIARKPCRIITTASADQPMKGLSVLLQALAAVRKIYPQVELLIVGKLKKGGSTEQLLHTLQLNAQVTFVSGITTCELVNYYASATLAVVPSLYEGFGLPAAEAMACGVPLVCSDGGALPEVVGDAAKVVSAGDASALQAAIEELLSRSDLRQQLSERGRQRMIQHYSWATVALKMSNYYNTMLTGTAKKYAELC